LERPTFIMINPAREKGLNEFWTSPQRFAQAEKVAEFDKPAGKTSIDVYQWHSIPAMAEQWAIRSGVERPVVMSRFSRMADTIGAARFESGNDAWAEADFVLVDNETLASGIFGQNSPNWLKQLPAGWALTQFVPGNWYLFRLISNAPPDHTLEARLDQVIALTGFDLFQPRGHLTAGQPVHLTLHWQALAHISEDYVVFAQLIGPDGQLYAQQDRPPLLPTTRWQPDYRLADGYTIPLGRNVAPGSYRLVVGMYEPISGQRVPAYQSDGRRWPDDAVVLTEVTIN
jgi:hypothetical protein